MIQEKDFLYRVPVKNTLVATPGQQVRNPEILVDLEGGEFMRGNMLDANSTNKLINQSVKDAVDNKLIESGYVTKDLLDAETSARTKGDEDLSAKIQAEQTRAEGKEKEISDKLAIVDGDSNTEGSFRKAIADVVAAAPEDLDTLKEIADKLAGNDDLHTALNQAITEKADTSALLNEVTRATGVENDLKTAISAKQDAGDYIPYDASDEDRYAIDKFLELRDENDGAMTISLGNISSSQNGGSNVYDISSTGISGQYMASQYSLGGENGIELQNGNNTLSLGYYGLTIRNGNINFNFNNAQGISWYVGDNIYSTIGPMGLATKSGDEAYTIFNIHDFIKIVSGATELNVSPIQFSGRVGNNGIQISPNMIALTSDGNVISLVSSGISLPDGDNNHVLTSNASTIDITQYALKAQLDTKQDKGNYVPYTLVANNGYGINSKVMVPYIMIVDSIEDVTRRIEINSKRIGFSQTGSPQHFDISVNGLSFMDTDTSTSEIVTTKYTVDGITSGKHSNCLATSDGTFKPISDFVQKTDADNNYASKIEYNALERLVVAQDNIIQKKQDKIAVNTIDVTGIETADISKLRTIVSNLLDALTLSGLIKQNAEL